jgi:hypothetical protein
MMEIHFHPPGQAEQEKKQRGINQNHADPFFVVGFHQYSIRNCIRDFASKFKLGYFCRLLFHDRVQIADAAVGKYDQVPVTMNITNFCKPRLGWPSVRRGG